MMIGYTKSLNPQAFAGGFFGRGIYVVLDADMLEAPYYKIEFKIKNPLVLRDPSSFDAFLEDVELGWDLRVGFVRNNLDPREVCVRGEGYDAIMIDMDKRQDIEQPIYVLLENAVVNVLESPTDVEEPDFWPGCWHCAHSIKLTGRCAAFPDGIPFDVLSGFTPHTSSLPGQATADVFEVKRSVFD